MITCSALSSPAGALSRLGARCRRSVVAASRSLSGVWGLLVTTWLGMTPLGPSLPGAELPTAERRPNLLVIQTDEHHYATLGCYGGMLEATPHLDWLASQGALCTSFYATTPVCSPSRAALVSGLYPHRTPVVTNNIPLRDEIVTFAELLRRQGYATGFAGKWHLDGNGKPQWSPRRKFGFEDNRFMFNRGHWKKLEDGPNGPRVGARNARGVPSYDLNGADSETFATDWLCQKAIDFIKQHQNDPFCYMLSLPDPHGPNTVRAPYDSMYQADQVVIPNTLLKKEGQIPKWGQPAGNVTAAQLRRIMPNYYGMVKCIDDNVGRIINTLREQGILDDTLIVFTSDHGDLCGEHGRLNKGVPYEGSARIPFLLYFPRQVKPGTVIPQALSCVDFLPTALDLMKVDYQQGVDGRNAAALFRGEDHSDWHDVAFLRGTQSWLCVLNDRYKLVYSKQDQPWLFDLQADPDELTNHFGRPGYEDITRDLTRQLLNYCQTYDDPYMQDDNIRQTMLKAIR